MGEVMTRGIINMPLEMVMGSINGIENYHSRAQSLLADYDALRAENERLRKVTHVMIPTDTMEQEFAKYHRRGFDAGIKQGLAERDELLAALKRLFSSYKELADSGDAGNWSLEALPEGMQAMEVMAKHRGEK